MSIIIKQRRCLVIDTHQLDMLEAHLSKEGFQTTFMQVGTINKIKENISNGIDWLLEFLGLEKQIDYVNNEKFGLVAYIGKKQQIHVRAYIDGRIESEIEPFVQHLEHTKSNPEAHLFHGLWYSADNTISFLLNEWGIRFQLSDGDKGEIYNSSDWKKFSSTRSVRRKIKQKIKPVFGARNASLVLEMFDEEVRRLKNAKIGKLLKRALKEDKFISFRK